MDGLGIQREGRKHGFHILRHSGATILHKEIGDIEVAQRALGHARRSTTEDIYDHAEIVVDEATVGMLLGAIVDDFSILQCSDVVN
jgi:integrase